MYQSCAVQLRGDVLFIELREQVDLCADVADTIGIVSYEEDLTDPILFACCVTVECAPLSSVRHRRTSRRLPRLQVSGERRGRP